jgi:hypothetical protein
MRGRTRVRLIAGTNTPTDEVQHAPAPPGPGASSPKSQTHFRGAEQWDMNGPFRASPAKDAFAEFIAHAALTLYHCLTMHFNFAITDAIIDLLLVEPTLTQKDIAIRLERHPATVGMIMNSDLFRARYEQRRGAQTAALTEAINTRLSRVAFRALELTEEILAEERTAVPLPALVDVADKALARLGYGPKMAANPAVVINNQTSVVAPVTPEQLRAARQKLIEAQAHASGSAGGVPSSGGGGEKASRPLAGEEETLLNEGGTRSTSGDA